MNPTVRFSGLLLLGAIACSGGSQQQQDQPSSGSVSGRSPSIAATATVPRAPARPPIDAPRPPAPVAPYQPDPAPGTRTLGYGTRIDATMQDTVSSQHGRAGETARAIVSRDVMDGSGNVVIPAGSPLMLTVAELQPAANSSDSDGTVVLAITSVSVRGVSYPLSADLESVPHVLVGHGVTLGSAEKVAVGAVLGTIAGRIIGRNTKGAVIGGAIGAGAGVIVAAHTQDRDVVIPSGTPIVMALTQPLVVNR